MSKSLPRVLWYCCMAWFGWVLLMGLIRPAAASPAVEERPRIGLVLGGGGARGLAHIGVLRLLEELQVPIDCIAGTSMGSIIGGLYAAGMTPNEMEQALQQTDWPAVFSDSPPRADLPFRTKQRQRVFLTNAGVGVKKGQIQLPKGLLQGQNLLLLLEELALPAASVQDFDQLKMPYRAVATDLATGERVVLRSGNLAKAMRASMSIPSILAPVEIDGRLLVDGGVSDNVPVDVARALCQPDVVIAVDVGAPLEPASQLTSVLSITNQLTSILTVRSAQEQIKTLDRRDILITPDLTGLSSIAFERSADAVQAGYNAALARRAVLRRWALPPESYQAVRASQPTWPDDPSPVIDFIQIKQNTRLSDQVIAAQLHTHVGERLDVATLNRDLNLIYGMGDFQQVSYKLVHAHGQTGLVIDARAKDVGPNVLDFGLWFGADLKGDSQFNLSAAYTMNQLNPLGGAWRNLVQMGSNIVLETSLYQPLDVEQRYFVDPWLNYQQYTLDTYRQSHGDNSRFRVHQTQAGVEIGRNLQRWGRLALGLRYSVGSNDLRLGQASPDEGDFNNSGLSLNWDVDTLDRVSFPTSGSLARLSYYHALPALGADQAFQTLSLELAQPYSWGKTTLIPRVRLGATLAGDLHLQDLFLLGGFLNLSGYQVGQVSGQYMGLTELIGLYRLDDASSAFTLPVYAGGSLELGGAWDELAEIQLDRLIPAGSLFLGADTLLGPLYLGAGLARGGNASVFLNLGKLF